MKKDLSYEKALTMLENLVQDLENGTIPLDKLGEKVAVANELVSLCQSKLRSIENSLEEIMCKA
jgi:exodeoxyribonuclease VII small subunit